MAAFLVEGRGSGRGDSAGDWRFVWLRVVGDCLLLDGYFTCIPDVPVPDVFRGLEKIVNICRFKRVEKIEKISFPLSNGLMSVILVPNQYGIVYNKFKNK